MDDTLHDFVLLNKIHKHVKQLCITTIHYKHGAYGVRVCSLSYSLVRWLLHAVEFHDKNAKIALIFSVSQKSPERLVQIT